MWKAWAGILVRLFPLRLRNLRLSSPTHISARIDVSSLSVRSRVKSPARSEKARDSTRDILLSLRSSEDRWRKCRNDLRLSSAISLVSRFTYHKEEKSYFACWTHILPNKNLDREERGASLGPPPWIRHCIPCCEFLKIDN